MSSWNSVTMIGNITRDAVAVTVGDNKTIARFSIAVNDRFSKNGETLFMDVDKWEPKGLLSFLTKGKSVCVSGRLKRDVWEKEGERREKVFIVADAIELLSDSASASSYATSSSSSSSASASSRASSPKRQEFMEPDDFHTTPF